MVEIGILAIGVFLGMGATFFIIALDKNVVITKPGENADGRQQPGMRKRGTAGEARSIYGNPAPPEEFWDDETS